MTISIKSKERFIPVEEIRLAAQNLSPYIYTHEDETYFPTSVESMKINWTTDLYNTEATISYDYNTGKTLNNNAPIYTNVQHLRTGEYLFSYAYMFAYNPCGPKLNVKAMVNFVVNPMNLNTNINVCPAGVHNGDIEHTQVLVDSSLNFISITIGYHEWESIHTRNDIEWDGTHPIVYMAKGSHAMYSHPGDNQYLTLWKVDKTLKGKCPGICKKLGIPYPCLKSCKYGISSSGILYDTVRKHNKFTGRVRILASNISSFEPFVVSPDEQNLLIYLGKFGEKIDNDGYYKFVKAVNLSLTGLYLVCSSCKSAIKGGLESDPAEFESNAPASLATKKWWKNEDRI